MFDSENEIQEKVIDLLRKYAGRRVNPSIKHRLFHDLGLAGDDAWEFLDEISMTFDIEVPEFEFAEHFPSEGDLGIWPFNLFFAPQKDRWKPITAEDLAHMLDSALKRKRPN